MTTLGLSGCGGLFGGRMAKRSGAPVVPLQANSNAPLQGTALGQRAPQKKPGLTAGVASAMKRAGQSVANSMHPKPKVVPANDPTSLNSNSGPLNPDVFVAAGKIHEQRGNFDAAQQQYHKALQSAPHHLPALLSSARVHDRREQFDEAVGQYQRAIQAHPRSSVALNDLGLCYARQGRSRESADVLARAIAIDGTNSRYRNNIAAVLVEMGRADDAYHHLAQAHGPAVAHYNLGVFLYQRQQTEQAAHHFAKATELDPSIAAAQQMVQRLASQPRSGRNFQAQRPTQTSPHHQIKQHSSNVVPAGLQNAPRGGSFQQPLQSLPAPSKEEGLQQFQQNAFNVRMEG